ncbi:MAG: Rho termination factor N-terminal domain-containing protein [Egibacteraceae bacterium]
MSTTNLNARRTARQAQQTTERAATTTKQAKRTFQDALADAGYASLGAADAAVTLARKAGQAAARVRLSAVLDDSRRGVEELAARGRALTGQIGRDPQVREASRRAEAASSQVKGAATSVGRAAQAQAEAVGNAAERVGGGAGTSARTTTPPRSRGTAAKKAGARTAKAADGRSTPRKRTAAKRSTPKQTAAKRTAAAQAPPAATSQPPTGAGRLEDRTVDELYERASELNLEGRSSMSKDELIAAIREQQ